MPKPYPQEFRDDVVMVAKHWPDGVTLEDIARDFDIHPMTLSNWLKKAKKRVRLLEQENGVLRGGRASRQAQPPNRMMNPLVRELADDGIPVTVSCRVLGLGRSAYYRWLDEPIIEGQLAEAYLASRVRRKRGRSVRDLLGQRIAPTLARYSPEETCSTRPRERPRSQGAQRGRCET